mgnify:CR=1 FL=1
MNKKIIYIFIIVWLFGVITGVLGFFVDINIYIHNIIFAILALFTILLSLCIGGFVLDSNIKLFKKLFKNKSK